MDGTRQVILVVDDEKNIRLTLRRLLEDEGYAALEAESAEKALEVLGAEPVDLGIFDIRLPGMDGLTLLSKARELWRDLPVIVISGHAEKHDVVDAMKRGAVDFLEKPPDRERVLVTVKNALERRVLETKVQTLAARDRRFDDEMLGDSPAMRKLREDIAKVAPTSGRVLVVGESGSGKELVAAEVHRLSKRAQGPFVKVNCAAIPSELIESELFGHEKGSFSGAAARRRGQFEVAHGGTLFLDEIGDMSASAQAKVLRALQTGEITRVGSERAIAVDVRVIAATNKDLEAEVRRGNFRSDLFYRLRSVNIRVPPLRERRDDIPAFFNEFARQISEKNGIPFAGITSEAMELLKSYHWPGNVRELRNAVESLIVIEKGRLVDVYSIRKYLRDFRDEERPRNLPVFTHKTPEQAERELLYRALLEMKNDIMDIKTILENRQAPLVSDAPSYVEANVDQESASGPDRVMPLDEVEKKMIIGALDRFSGNRRLASRALNISERTLYRKIKEYGLD